MATLTKPGKCDLVYTPDALASTIVAHFKPQISGRILEPCYGEGAFLRAFEAHGFADVATAEITKGSDFFEFSKRVDWTITNPPWSLYRKFARHAYEVSNNVVFLALLCHALTLSGRLRDMQEAGFGIKEIALVDYPPKPWPQSGFQLAAVHYSKSHGNITTWTDLRSRQCII